MRNLSASLPAARSPILAALLIALCPWATLASAALPEPPRIFVDTDVVETAGATIDVPSGGDLQAALYAAQPGDVIVLEAGAVYHGPFMLPRKAGDEWITVTSSRGRRAAGRAPCRARRTRRGWRRSKAGIHRWCRRSPVRTTIGSSVSRSGRRANTFMFNIVDVGSDARDPADIPHHLIFDRCYLHGDSAQGSRRAVAMNGAHVAVVESYLADLKEGRE